MILVTIAFVRKFFKRNFLSAQILPHHATIIPYQENNRIVLTGNQQYTSTQLNYPTDFLSDRSVQTGGYVNSNQDYPLSYNTVVFKSY